jgi:hypothetical protein
MRGSRTRRVLRYCSGAFATLLAAFASPAPTAAQWFQCVDANAEYVRIQHVVGLSPPIVASVGSDGPLLLVDSTALRAYPNSVRQFAYARECARHWLRHSLYPDTGWVARSRVQSADCAAIGLMARHQDFRWDALIQLREDIANLAASGHVWEILGKPPRTFDLDFCLQTIGLLPLRSSIVDWERDDAASRRVVRERNLDSVRWSTSADSPFVNYRYGVMNSGKAPVHLTFTVDVALIPREGGPPVGVAHSHVHRMILQAGERRIVRGRLEWIASDRLMPGLRPRIRARWVSPFERQAVVNTHYQRVGGLSAASTRTKASPRLRSAWRTAETTKATAYVVAIPISRCVRPSWYVPLRPLP